MDSVDRWEGIWKGRSWDILIYLCISVEAGIYPKRMLLQNSVRKGFCHTACRTSMVCGR